LKFSVFFHNFEDSKDLLFSNTEDNLMK